MKKMLVVVDYQNDFVDGALGFAGAETIDAGIAAKVKEYSDNGDYVLFTYDSHNEESYMETREGKNLPVLHTIIRTPGWELYGKTKQAHDAIPHKIDINKYDNFGVSPHQMVLLPNDVDEIEFCGLVGTICVFSNIPIFQARYPQATVIFNSQLSKSSDADLQEKMIDLLKNIQVKVI